MSRYVQTMHILKFTIALLAGLFATSRLPAETLGDYWNTAEEESKYYKIVEIPIPDNLAIEAGSFEVLPNNQLAIGTRRGDIYFVDGAFAKNPLPQFTRFASGLDEVLGMSFRDGAFYVTQQTEVTRITDANQDGTADHFETLSDAWGFRNYHEFAFGSKPDPEGNIWVALCLSKSYESDEPFRGWCLKITPDGKTIPICSGIRSPCGIGPNEHGVMFYAESQGPWNGSCSLKVLEPGGFMGHPASFKWYDLAGNMGPAPKMPNTRSRLLTESQRVDELVPYAVVFPYIKMGRSISGFQVDRTGGKFGPFENQIFVCDFSLSVMMRATTEKVNGVWQGACYPFREGLATGLLACEFTPEGDLIVGGTNRGWPVRGPREFAIQRLDWTGLVPFEIKEINARPEGFLITFTKPVDRQVAGRNDSYNLSTYTHVYQQGYGSPEVDQTTPQVTRAVVSADGLQVELTIDGLVQGHVHDFDLGPMRSAEGEKLVHTKAYYTLNEIPKRPPNIVCILADDLGYGDLGCYNATSKIPTPNLDRLAAEGMRFTDAHSPCTVCTPTRYSLMTGQMAFRVPRGGTVFTGAGGPSLITSNRFTLPQMLRERDYATACVGKWHIGMTFYDNEGVAIDQGGLEAVKRIDYTRAIKGGPLDCGFDQFFGTACCPTTDWLYAYIDGDRIPVPPTMQLDRSGLPTHPYANDNRPGMVAPDFDLEEVDMKFLEKSKQFLENHVQQDPDKPFFLFHSTQAVHLPSFPGNAFKGKTTSGPHGDFIFELDYVVGELMETLKRLGVADNTIVMFTSDNGPEVPTVYHMRHDHDHDGARPWRGVKRDNWEGGHRVPFIVKWPGKIQPGATSDQLTSLTDVMATVADIMDVSLPAGAAEDSFSMLPALTGKAGSGSIRPYILQQGFGGSRYLAIRQGKWKYLAHQGSGGNNYENHPQLKEYYLPDTAPEAPGQLYDLEADPGETKNVYFEHRDIAEALNALLQRSIASGLSNPARAK